MLLRRRPVAPVLAVVGVALVAGCTSTGGDPPPTPSSSTPPTVSSSAPVEITSAAQLGAAMQAGAVTVTSAALDVNGAGTTGTFTGDGTMTLAAGHVTALEISGPPSITSAADRLLVVGRDVYVRAETFDATPAGPWRRVTPSSADPTAAKAAGSAAALYAVADFAGLAAAFGAATSFDEVGPVVDGTRYSCDSFAPTARLTSLFGADVVPTDAYVDVDDAGRPVQTWTNMTVDGAKYGVKVRWTGFDDPVTIEPPAASEVAAD